MWQRRAHNTTTVHRLSSLPLLSPQAALLKLHVAGLSQSTQATAAQAWEASGTASPPGSPAASAGKLPAALLSPEPANAGFLETEWGAHTGWAALSSRRPAVEVRMQA